MTHDKKAIDNLIATTLEALDAYMIPLPGGKAEDQLIDRLRAFYTQLIEDLRK